MSSISPETITIEELSRPEVTADPYPFYRALREQSPIYGYKDYPPGTVPGEDEPPTAWAVFAHDQVTEVARRADLFSSCDPVQEASGAPTLMLVNHDDPEHRELRDKVQHFFTTSAVAPLSDWLDGVCDSLIGEMIGTTTDVMQGLASTLPAMVMAKILGMPDEDYPLFRRWATAFMLSAEMTAEERVASNGEMFAYFTEKVTGRAEGAAGDDFISHLLASDLSPEEVIRFCFTLVVAGAETTTGLIGNLFWQADRECETYGRVQENPELMDAFIEETLRISGPPQRLFRIATQDVLLGGQQIKEGDWVAIFFAAANHDPKVWPEPQTFKLDRPRNRSHYSFGHGVHQCLGAMLVRLEARAVVGALTRRSVKVRVIETDSFRQTATQLSYTFERLLVELSC